MHEDESRLFLLRTGVQRKEELAVNFEAIGSVEDHLLRRRKLVRWKILWPRFRAQCLNNSVCLEGTSERPRRMPCIRPNIDIVFSVTQRYRAPFVASTASELARTISAGTDRPDVPPINVATIGVEKYGFAIRR